MKKRKIKKRVLALSLLLPSVAPSFAMDQEAEKKKGGSNVLQITRKKILDSGRDKDKTEEGIKKPVYLRVEKSKSEYLLEAIGLFNKELENKRKPQAQEESPLLKFHINVHRLPIEVLQPIIDGIASSAPSADLAEILEALLEDYPSEKTELFQNWANTREPSLRTSLVRTFRPEAPRAFFEQAKRGGVYRAILHSIYARVVHDAWNQKLAMGQHSIYDENALIYHYSLGSYKRPQTAPVVVASKPSPSAAAAVAVKKDDEESKLAKCGPFQKQLKAFQLTVNKVATEDKDLFLTPAYQQAYGELLNFQARIWKSINFDALTEKTWDKEWLLTHLSASITNLFQKTIPFNQRISPEMLEKLKYYLSLKPEAEEKMLQAWINTSSEETREHLQFAFDNRKEKKYAMYWEEWAKGFKPFETIGLCIYNNVAHTQMEVYKDRLGKTNFNQVEAQKEYCFWKAVANQYQLVASFSFDAHNWLKDVQ